jgi:hypothetical protein
MHFREYHLRRFHALSRLLAANISTPLLVSSGPVRIRILYTGRGARVHRLARGVRLPLAGEIAPTVVGLADLVDNVGSFSLRRTQWQDDGARPHGSGYRWLSSSPVRSACYWQLTARPSTNVLTLGIAAALHPRLSTGDRYAVALDPYSWQQAEYSPARR